MSLLFYPLVWEYGEFLFSSIELDAVFKLIRMRRKFIKKRFSDQTKSEKDKKTINEKLTKVELMLIQNRVIGCPQEKRRRRRKNQQITINLNIDQSKEKYTLSPIWRSVFLSDLDQQPNTKSNSNKTEIKNENQKNPKKNTKIPRATRTIGLLGFKIFQNLRKGPLSRENLSILTGFSKQRVCTVLGIYKLLNLVTENEEKGLFNWNAQQCNLLPNVAPYCHSVCKAKQTRKQLTLKAEELIAKLIKRSRQENVENGEAIDKVKILLKKMNLLKTTNLIDLQKKYYSNMEEKLQNKEHDQQEQQGTQEEKDEKVEKQNIDLNKNEIREMITKLKEQKQKFIKQRNYILQSVSTTNNKKNKQTKKQEKTKKRKIIKKQIKPRKYFQQTQQHIVKQEQIHLVKQGQGQGQIQILKQKPVQNCLKNKPNDTISLNQSSNDTISNNQSSNESSVSQLVQGESFIFSTSQTMDSLEVDTPKLVSKSSPFKRTLVHPNLYSFKSPICLHSSNLSTQSNLHKIENSNTQFVETTNTITNHQSNQNSIPKTNTNTNTESNTTDQDPNTKTFVRSIQQYLNMQTEVDNNRKSTQTSFSLSEMFFSSPLNPPIQPETTLLPNNNDFPTNDECNDLQPFFKPSCSKLLVLSDDSMQNYLEIPHFYPNHIETTIHDYENSHFNFEDNW
ncbi:myb-like protein x [Anaeramoeba flamelloides]|uniref:Myb-like protein x n=1 Tax=Anaeramoeba flamelloides TaxID=1746091 RepID=A0AAV8AKP6_9EUKA|nr:myb-like protein x [Anaeramoeba flamelloides]